MKEKVHIFTKQHKKWYKGYSLICSHLAEPSIFSADEKSRYTELRSICCHLAEPSMFQFRWDKLRLYQILRIRIPGHSLLIIAVLILAQLFITWFILCSTNISWLCISLTIFWNIREILTSLQKRCYDIDSFDL